MRSRVTEALRQHWAIWTRTPHNLEVSIIPTYGLEPQCLLRDIVVDRQPPVVHVPPQRRPLVPGRGHRFAQRRLGQAPIRQVIQLLLAPIEDRHRLPLPQRLALIRREVARTILDVVELLDPLQDLVGLARGIGPRLEELPARVRPAGHFLGE